MSTKRTVGRTPRPLQTALRHLHFHHEELEQELELELDQEQEQVRAWEEMEEQGEREVSLGHFKMSKSPCQLLE